MVTPLNVPREIRVAADEYGNPVFVWHQEQAEAGGPHQECLAHRR